MRDQRPLTPQSLAILQGDRTGTFRGAQREGPSGSRSALGGNMLKSLVTPAVPQGLCHPHCWED